MRRTVCHICVGVGLVFVAVAASFAQGLKALRDGEAYTIYSILLKNEPAVREGRMKRILLSDETHGYGSAQLTVCLENEPNTDAALVSLVRSYQEENKYRWQLERKFDLPIPYELVEEKTFRDFFKDPDAPGWNNFFKAYPGSGYFFNLSGITFDSHKTRALVHVGYGCGFTCGHSNYHLLEKRDGKWTEVPFLMSSNSCGGAS
jgi:hypothetical protein